LKEFFATKAVADKPEEIERKILICVPMAITKPCNGSLGIAVIAARYGGIKRDKIMAKMQLESAEHG